MLATNFEFVVKFHITSANAVLLGVDNAELSTLVHDYYYY